jgi:hypothetical protein
VKTVSSHLGSMVRLFGRVHRWAAALVLFLLLAALGPLAAAMPGIQSQTYDGCSVWYDEPIEISSGSLTDLHPPTGPPSALVITIQAQVIQRPCFAAWRLAAVCHPLAVPLTVAEGVSVEMAYRLHRFYDPSLGRFTQEDPARAGQNWFAYADNDPVNKWDPSGLDWEWVGAGNGTNGHQSGWKHVEGTSRYVPVPKFSPDQVGGIDYIDAGAYVAIRDAYMQGVFAQQVAQSQDGDIFGAQVGAASRPGQVLSVYNLARSTSSFLGPFELSPLAALEGGDVQKASIARGIGFMPTPDIQVNPGGMQSTGSMPVLLRSERAGGFDDAVQAYNQSAEYERGLGQSLAHVAFDQEMGRILQEDRILGIREAIVGTGATVAGVGIDLVLGGPSGEGMAIAAAIRSRVFSAIGQGFGRAATAVGSRLQTAGINTFILHGQAVRMATVRIAQSRAVVAGVRAAAPSWNMFQKVTAGSGISRAGIGAAWNVYKPIGYGLYGSLGQIIAGGSRTAYTYTVATGFVGSVSGLYGPDSEPTIPSANPLTLPFEVGQIVGGLLKVGLDALQ